MPAATLTRIGLPATTTVSLTLVVVLLMSSSAWVAPAWTKPAMLTVIPPVNAAAMPPARRIMAALPLVIVKLTALAPLQEGAAQELVVPVAFSFDAAITVSVALLTVCCWIR